MRRLLAVIVVAVIVGACAEAVAEGLPPAGHPVMVPGGFRSIRGKVVEKLDVSQYTYLRLNTGAEEIWAAVSRTDSKVGEEVTVTNAYAMEKFESRGLGRTFDVVYFGSLAPPMGQSDAARLAAQHRGVARDPEVEVQRVARAPGADGRTVEEVWRQREALKGRPIAVRGKVVKATPVMGKTFLHLRDGTGAAAGGTNDLPVTTSEEVAVGDVVTARGTVVVDKDFGSGYRYRVIVEEARIAR